MSSQACVAWNRQWHKACQSPTRLSNRRPTGVLSSALQLRLMQLERLVTAIEDELSDDQKLQNIGERVANVTDGR